MIGSKYANWFAKGSKQPIVVIGDLMLDKYISGSVTRISPEAPVPIINVNSEYAVPGGAANVALQLHDLGANVRLIGTIGLDEAGKELMGMLLAAGLDCSYIETHGARPTTTKLRILSQGQHTIRVDKENTSPLSQTLIDTMVAACQECQPSIIILSDYCKGTVTPDLSSRIIQDARAPLIVDTKSTNLKQFAGATGFTPNLNELFKMASMPYQEGVTAVKAASKSIMKTTHCRWVLTTMGDNGMYLYGPGDTKLHIEAESCNVQDVTGAGDTAVATLTHLLALGVGIEDAARVANVAAAIAVSKVGTDIVRPAEIVARLTEKELGLAKLLTKEQISYRLPPGKKIVFTNGCFDLLHAGHVSLLQRAKALGDILIVGVNTDTSVKKLKGEGRPVISQGDRAMILSALECVDFVIFFEDPTPLNVINAIKPHVLVKGKEPGVELTNVVGNDVLKEYGGQVVLLEKIPGHSTTNTVKKIAKS